MCENWNTYSIKHKFRHDPPKTLMEINKSIVDITNTANKLIPIKLAQQDSEVSYWDMSPRMMSSKRCKAS